jgi:hypothetical protein
MTPLAFPEVSRLISGGFLGVDIISRGAGSFGAGEIKDLT